MTFYSISDIHILAFTTCVSLRQIDAPFCGEFISPPDSRRGVIMLEGFMAALLVAMVGIVVISAFLGGLVGALLGALLGWLTSAPLVVAIPVGAIIGAVLAGTLAVWRLWYRKNNNHPVDEQA